MQQAPPDLPSLMRKVVSKVNFVRMIQESRHRELWNGFMMLLSIFAGIEIPVRLVLDVPTEGWIYVMDWVMTFFFSVDVLVNLLIFRDKDDVEKEKEHQPINKHYLKTWFTVDFLAAIPFGQLITGFSFDTTQGFKALRIVKLTRLLKLVKLIPLIRRWGNLKSINPSMLRMLLFFFLVLFVAHWMACGWIALSTFDVNQDPVGTYIRSLYWVFTTMTTVGYGDITPVTNWQVVYAVMIMIIGVATYGYVIANLSSYFGNIDSARSDFTRKMAIVNAFLAYREIPKGLENRIRSYYNYIWDNRLDHDEDEVINDLPDSLKLEVELFLRQPLISKVPLFQRASEEFKNEIVDHLHIHVYMPGDYIVRKNEKGDSMFFVSKGTVEILDDYENSFVSLTDGSFFGEISLLKKQPRNSSVRAQTFCNIYSLNKDNFDTLLEKYPDFKQEVLKISKAREENRNRYLEEMEHRIE